jgi:predicted SnoaL-like aldol condensation-catalyzing enzyme
MMPRRLALAFVSAFVACSETPHEPSTGTGGASTGGDSSAGQNAAMGGRSGADTGGSASGGQLGGASPANSGAGRGGASSAGADSTTGGSSPNAGTSGAAASAGRSGSTGGVSGSGGASSAGSSGGGASNTGAGNGGASNAEGGSAGDGGASAKCDASVSRSNRELVSKAIDQLFFEKDIAAVDRYWADPYYQHNPIAKSGVSTFKSLMGSLVSSSSFSYQRLLTLAECDLVVVYGRYSQTGVIFDMFRVRDAKIMEHWDSDTNQASESSDLDAFDESAPTSENRALFANFSEVVLLGGQRARASEFSSASYTEHHGAPASGAGALTAYLEAENVSYTKVHHVIVDGNYVFALSEGKRGTAEFGFYDLFRVEAGKLAEHWDSRRSVPSSTMSGLGIF